MVDTCLLYGTHIGKYKEYGVNITTMFIGKLSIQALV